VKQYFFGSYIRLAILNVPHKLCPISGSYESFWVKNVITTCVRLSIVTSL
jgi:hypothetical protein